MRFTFEATTEFSNSVKDVETLVRYAIQEGDSENEKNRLLFLKLAVVLSVTKFQVFIESVLEEYRFKIRTSNKRYGDIQINLRLNSIRLSSIDKVISRKLENFQTYDLIKLTEIKEIACKMLAFCNDSEIISDDLQFDTKFPLGKTGLEDLTKLFRQINGENIFENPPLDINRLNEILGRRHAIIHEDSNPQLTEEVVGKYKEFLVDLVKFINDYLNDNL